MRSHIGAAMTEEWEKKIRALEEETERLEKENAELARRILIVTRENWALERQCRFMERNKSMGWSFKVH